jgi:hypothetical protein
MLQRLLQENFHRLSISDVNELIAWLENRGYVKVTRLEKGAFLLAHITRADGIEPPPKD